MKWLSCIFAFYIILLAAVPCCALDDCSNNKSQAQQPAHENGDGDCGNCSPFFSCQGCATATIVYEPAQFEIASLKISAVYAVYMQVSLPDADYDFWQPPRLG